MTVSDKEDGGQPGPESQDQTGLSDAELENLRAKRFQERVERVLAAMRRERIDWRGIAHITPEGRIAVRVVPVEVDHPPTA